MTAITGDRDAVFELQGVGLSRSGRPLVDDVSLAVRSGELLVVMGENGAGKSTLLRILAGDFRPDRGVVSLNGRRLEAWSVLEQARQRAVLPQQATVSFAFTAFEVVLLGRSPHHAGMPAAADRAIARDALARTDALKFADRNYQTLSGGERARVMLARAFAQVASPSCGSDAAPVAEERRGLLLDEPSAALDIAHQHSAFRAIRTLASVGRVGVMAVTHDPNIAARYADRVALMKDGRLMALGGVDETLTEEAMSVCFSVPMKRVQHPTRHVPLLVAIPD